MGCTTSSPRTRRPTISAEPPTTRSQLDSIAPAANNGNSYRIDSRHFLSERQLYSITKSWKGIAREMDSTGVNMFVRLFETNSDFKQMFANLQRLNTSAELRSSSALDAHALKVMSSLDDAITNLEDYDYVCNMLFRVGLLHTTFQGFNPDMFLKIEEPFMLAVKETLGDRFSVNIQNTYRETIQFILQTLKDGFHQHLEEP